jgi:transposase
VPSIIGKQRGERTYYYLVESARVDGKPRIVSQEYLGTSEEVVAKLAGGGDGFPDRTRHRAFGDVAAVWGLVEDLDIVGIIDGIVGPRRSDASASIGTYLALAATNRVVAPVSKAGFGRWWDTTALDQIVRPRLAAAALDHRRFWDAMHAVDGAQLAEIERAITARIVDQFGLDLSGCVLDMTNFATFIDSANDKAPIAQRGKAKQKRTDLRLVGLGLVVTRDGGIPLVSHAYPGNKPDVTQFAAVLGKLAARHAAVAVSAGVDAPAEITVVFDAGQNSQTNFDHLAALGVHYVGSVPPSDLPDLLALPKRRRRIVDADRFGGLTALDTRREIYRTGRRVVLTHSPTLHAKQSAGFDQTLAKATRRLSELADTLAGGNTRRTRATVEREIDNICHHSWAKRVITWTLTGDTPAEHRLSFHLDKAARTTLEAQVFGKRVLITDRETWPVAEVVAGYRSQSDAEFSFRQLKDRRVVSFSPMHHWTDHNIRVHLFTCVLALQLAHLMRRMADQAGLHLSVRELLATLAGIEESVLIYPSTGGRPKARRMLTETTPEQDQLAAIFHLDRWAPRS